MGLALLVIVLVLLLAGLPNWQYSRKWGYAPSSALGLVFLVVLVLVLMGKL